MSKIFNFGETVNGYEVKILKGRETRAGAGILFLFEFISFVNCMVTQSLFIM